MRALVPLVRRVRARLGDRDDGFFAVELAIVTPLVILMLLTVVAFGRVEQGRQQVDQAAAAAARAASLAFSPAEAASAGRSAAQSTLSQAGMSCVNFDVAVDTAAFRPGGQVTVTVGCDANLNQLALTGVPGSVRLTASASAAIESYRDVGAGSR